MAEDSPPRDGTPARRRRRRRRRPPGEQSNPQAAPASDKPKPRSRRRRRRPDKDGAPASSTASSTASPTNRRRRRRRRRDGEPQSSERGADTTPSRRQPRPDPSAESGGQRPPQRAAPPDIDAGWDSDAADPEVDGELQDTAAYGDDSDAPIPEGVIAGDLPADPAADDPDPVTAALDDDLAEDVFNTGEVRNLVGVKFATAGRVYHFDGGAGSYQPGDEVVVEGDRGQRIGHVATASRRQAHKHSNLKRIIRRTDRNDRRTIDRNQQLGDEALRGARKQVKAMGLPIKVFRAEVAHGGRKVRMHFTSEERADFRNLARELSQSLRTRVELRQTGVRDQAKTIGGIGSCGQPHCCTTWLPDFVPVSIKNAKDQGLVLNPAKVSGQCGRLKCCLVYEQETYAELRRGLPKLGKRVVTEAGEGRVVEVDVLHRRVRVSLSGGESKVFTGDEVEPLFPSQKPKQPRNKPR